MHSEKTSLRVATYDTQMTAALETVEQRMRRDELGLVQDFLSNSESRTQTYRAKRLKGERMSTNQTGLVI